MLEIVARLIDALVAVAPKISGARHRSLRRKAGGALFRIYVQGLAVVKGGALLIEEATRAEDRGVLKVLARAQTARVKDLADLVWDEQSNLALLFAGEAFRLDLLLGGKIGLLHQMQDHWDLPRGTKDQDVASLKRALAELNRLAECLERLRTVILEHFTLDELLLDPRRGRQRSLDAAEHALGRLTAQ